MGWFRNLRSAPPGFAYAPQPPYPLKARKKHWIGRGKFELRSNANGTVSSVLMLESTGHDLLDETCKETLANWRSSPGPIPKDTIPDHLLHVQREAVTSLA